MYSVPGWKPVKHDGRGAAMSSPGRARPDRAFASSTPPPPLLLSARNLHLPSLQQQGRRLEYPGFTFDNRHIATCDNCRTPPSHWFPQRTAALRINETLITSSASVHWGG